MDQNALDALANTHKSVISLVSSAGRVRPRVFLAFAPAFAISVGVHLFGPESWKGPALLAAGAFLGMLVTLLSSPPHYIESWLLGSEAERRTGRQLRRLPKKHWLIRHDVQRQNWNWDHVAIGPPGLFVIETKVLSGRAELLGDGRLQVVRVDDEQDSFVFDRLHRLVKANAIDLSQIMREETGRRLWVNPVVVIWGSFPKGIEVLDEVVYLSGDRLAEWLKDLPPKLDERRRQEIAVRLTQLTDNQP